MILPSPFPDMAIISALAVEPLTVPANTPETIQALDQVQDVLMAMPQVPLMTEHVIHGGIYARTVRLAPGVAITGALVKVPTILSVHGHAQVFVGSEWQELVGTNVIAASAGRKQLFVALSPVVITMVFKTTAKTVEEAENEFTDEADLLLSRREGTDVTIITGE
jgi:hypothetical protein